MRGSSGCVSSSCPKAVTKSRSGAMAFAVCGVASAMWVMAFPRGDVWRVRRSARVLRLVAAHLDMRDVVERVADARRAEAAAPHAAGVCRDQARPRDPAQCRPVAEGDGRGG